MMRDAEIVCVGQAVVDCINRGWHDDVAMNVQNWVESISLHVGGDAFNESVILRRMGHSVRIVCGMGKDLAGDLIISQLEKNGIDTGAVERLEGEATPVADILLSQNGQRKSVTSRASLLKSYSPSPKHIEGCRVLSLASLFRPPLANPDNIVRLVRAAKAQGSIVCADTKLPVVPELGLDSIKEILPLIDYIFPNENEAARFTGQSSFEDMAKALLDMGIGHVVVKCGPAGVLAMSRDESFTVPSFPVEAVDSTGAGDNFVAGFISSLLHGSNFYDCCLFGTAAAANCVMSIGTTTGVKSRQQVEDFLKEHGC